MKRRSLAAISLGIAAALVLTGYTAQGSVQSTGAAQASENPGSLTMLVTDSPSADGLKVLAKKYEKKTGTKVKFVQVSYDQLATKMILAAKNKQDSYDLAQVDAGYLPQLVSAGALTSLDSDIKGDKQYDYADFPKGLKAYAKYKGVSYSVPLSTEPYLQWYRTDIYSKLGLKPAKNSAEELSNARALKQAGDIGYGGVYDASGAAYFYASKLQAMGGRLLNPKTNRPLLDTAVAKDAMKRYLALADYGPSGVDSATVYNAVDSFSQLNVGQMTLASGWWSTVNDKSSSKSAGLVATARTPMDKDGSYSSVSSLFGWVAGISAASNHQRAAWKFLSWALSAKNVNTFINAGAPPVARISTTSNAKYLKELPYLAAAGKAADNGVALPRIPELPQIITALSQDISSMATNQLTIDAGMKKAQQDVMNILVQSGRYKG